MDGVTVTVTMTAEGFMEFMAWKKDQDYYEKELDREISKRELLAKKVAWSIEADQKQFGKVKIVDQEHAAELLELANEFLS